MDPRTSTSKVLKDTGNYKLKGTFDAKHLDRLITYGANVSPITKRAIAPPILPRPSFVVKSDLRKEKYNNMR